MMNRFALGMVLCAFISLVACKPNVGEKDIGSIMTQLWDNMDGLQRVMDVLKREDQQKKKTKPVKDEPNKKEENLQ